MPRLGPTLFDGDTPPVPFSGATATSRAASHSGAWLAVRTWTEKQSALLQLIDSAGPFTDKELATLLAWDVGSVNSIRNSVADRLEFAGYEVIDWGPRPGRARYTRRQRWRIRRRYGAQAVRDLPRKEVRAMEDETKTDEQQPADGGGEAASSGQADGAGSESEPEKKDGE